MKNLLLLLVFLISFQLSANEIDERVSDIYFGNGILTTQAEAEKSLYNILKPSIKNKIYFNDEENIKKSHNFALAYNSTFKTTEVAGIPGGELGEVAGGILDIMESYEQLNNTSVGWKAFSALKSMVMEIGFKRQPIGTYLKKKIFDYLINKALPDYLATYISVQMTENDFARVKKLSEKAVDDIIKKAHDEDLKEMVSNYKKSIKAGHGVIAVTHSQGNLFPSTIQDYHTL